MTTTEITRENFTAAITKAVEARGQDYHYPFEEKLFSEQGPEFGASCQYKREDGSPSCIIGYALHLINPELVPERGEPIAASDLLNRLGVVDSYLMKAAEAAQYDQDNGTSWGRALQTFNLTLANAPTV